MFDLAWSEIALIAVVAVVVIGPKDLPDAVRGVAKGIQKLRRMAGEFQGHLDEVVREAKLEDVRDQIRDIRNFDLKSVVEKHVDSDGTIRDTFRDDPFRMPPPPTSDAAPAAGTAATDAAAAPVDATEAAATMPDAPPAADAPVLTAADPLPPAPNAGAEVASGLDPLPAARPEPAIAAPSPAAEPPPVGPRPVNIA